MESSDSSRTEHGRSQRVGRYFNSTPSPDFPQSAVVAGLIGLAAIVFTLLILPGAWKIPAIAVAIFALYRSWSLYDAYAGNRTPTDRDMDEQLHSDVTSLMSRIIAHPEGTTTPSDPHDVPVAQLVAIDIETTDPHEDTDTARVHRGQDGQLRAERYVISSAIFDDATATIYHHSLDFRTGRIHFNSRIVVPYANFALRETYQP